MHNVTLVCTHHSELGNCNADALFEIIESIRPDMIFEELPAVLFDRFYKGNTIPFETPEIQCVRRYLKIHLAKHYPVDIEVVDSLTTNQINNLFASIKKYHVYLQLEEKQKKLVFEEGYEFINSRENEALIEEKISLEKNLISFQLNRIQLSRMHDLFYEEQHKREYAIIENIYKYSKENEYNQAILLIGSGHRKSIIEKIKKYQSESDLKLNWAFYGN